MTVYQIAKYVIDAAIIIDVFAIAVTLYAAIRTKKKVLALTVIAEIATMICLYVLYLMISIGQYKTIDLRDESGVSMHLQCLEEAAPDRENTYEIL